ncbi:hypothetical protein PO124_19005 [Bacillus licheniformis]|nr:hypothetical protein [Bacillus licheniformis]
MRPMMFVLLPVIYLIAMIPKTSTPCLHLVTLLETAAFI